MDLFAAIEREGIQIDSNGSEIQYIPNVFSRSESDIFFQTLYREIDWQQECVSLYGKNHKMPRLSAFYGDEGIQYTYSGLTSKAKAWTGALLNLKEKAENLAAASFNSVLLNLYRDGHDAMGWHSDDEFELGKKPIIASLSFGETRRFDMRYKSNHALRYQVGLESGSILVMRGTIQHFWQHHIAKCSVTLAPRINLTFRQVHPFKNVV